MRIKWIIRRKIQKEYRTDWRSVKMACALSNTARLLKCCSRNVMKVNLRFCSSESKYGKSNKDFTSFTTKPSGFKDFERTPSLRVIASIIINGASIPPNSKLFLDRAFVYSLFHALFEGQSYLKNGRCRFACVLKDRWTSLLIFT